MSKPIEPLPDWERVLSSAARLQRILPEMVLVGGTAAALHKNASPPRLFRVGDIKSHQTGQVSLRT